MFSFHRDLHAPIDNNHDTSASAAAPPPSGFGTWDCPLSPVSDFNDSDIDFPPSTFRRRFSSSATTSSLPNFNNFQPPADLNTCKIPDLPCSAYYIPNFITVAEEQQLLNKVHPHPSLSPLAERILFLQEARLIP